MTQTLAPAPKLTAVEKRTAFLVEVAKPVNDHYKLAILMDQAGQDFPAHPANEVFVKVADRIAEEGPKLGKTARWLAACQWSKNAIEENPESESHVRWAVVQGSVYLAHAID